MNAKLSIGLALGSGSSRGWSHIGIIKALAELGITPNIVCGTSIGSLVGAAYVSGNIDQLEQWTRSLTRLETIRFFEINTSLSGFVNTDRFHHFLNQNVARDKDVIEDLHKVYASVATDLETGSEMDDQTACIREPLVSQISLPVSRSVATEA